jgi:hypothetical protein
MFVEGARIIGNRHQKLLHEAWCKMCRDVGSVDVCIANGDLIDGPQRLEEGKLVVTTDFEVQCQWAAELLNMIDAKMFYLTKGTDYHTVRGVCAEQYIAELLRSKYGRKAKFRNELRCKVGWAKVTANHHVPVSHSWYRATAISRDLLLYALNEAEYGKTDLVVRSHAHYFVQVGFGSMWAVVTPGWQLRTPFASKKDLVSAPRIGYVVAEIGPESDKHIDIHARLFNIAPPLEEDDFDEDCKDT